MAFHFTLKTLLRLRESLEKCEQQRLRVISAQVVHARAEIELLDARIEADWQQTFKVVATGISGAELRFDALRENACRERRDMLVKKLEELEQERRNQQMRCTEARQKREILTNLRDRRLAAYHLEELRREQQLIDELFLVRRGASRDE